jgi:colanic acid biosynthesis glycosyl transferase WcaI
MIVTRATLDDVSGIVVAHREAFPDFFLTLLGERFLRRFYSAMVRDPDALAFVGKIEGRIGGFAVGTLEPRAFFRKLLFREGLGFCLDATRALLRRPYFVGRRLLRGLTYRGEAPALQEGAALVSSIAVLPAASGTGLASAMLVAFCDEAARRGSSVVYLLTDRDYNPAANRFYIKAGFSLETEIVRSGQRPMNRYIRVLQGNPPR